MDLARVHAWLAQESYWAKGRERAVVERSLAGSRPYSVHTEDRQVAFARVVTDAATFAWICDVFVDEQYRGQGLGTWMVESIVQDLAVVGVPRVLLATKDAQEVYRRCGFTAMKGTDRWMQIDQRPNQLNQLNQELSPVRDQEPDQEFVPA